MILSFWSDTIIWISFSETDDDVIEFDFHAFVADVLYVTVELLDWIRVVIAAIAFQLGDVIVVIRGGGVDDVLEFVFVPQSTLLDMISEVHSLEMLIGLAVQLAVGLKVSFIAT